MPSFIAACAIAIGVALGAAVILDHLNKPADQAYVSPVSVRI